MEAFTYIISSLLQCNYGKFISSNTIKPITCNLHNKKILSQAAYSRGVQMRIWIRIWIRNKKFEDYQFGSFFYEVGEARKIVNIIPNPKFLLNISMQKKKKWNKHCKPHKEKNTSPLMYFIKSLNFLLGWTVQLFKISVLNTLTPSLQVGEEVKMPSILFLGPAHLNNNRS